MSVFLPVMWETSRSRRARRAWRRKAAAGRVPGRSQPRVRCSHLHLRRFAADDRTLCGYRLPPDPKAFVDVADVDFAGVAQCVPCAVLAACEAEHAVVGGRPGITNLPVGVCEQTLRCACSAQVVGRGATMDEARREASRAHRDHVARVVRAAVERRRAA